MTSAIPTSETRVRFRYRDTWLLLASLILSPYTNRREALIQRLALGEGAAGRDRLRYRLNDLRHGPPDRGVGGRSSGGLGTGCVVADSATIALAPGMVRTDFQELQEALSELPTLATPEPRVANLRSAALLLRGQFMEGYELAGQGDGWLEAMRFEVDRLAAEVWLQLARALDQTGDRRGAFDAARKAYAYAPDSPDALELLLELADGSRDLDEVLQLSRRLGIEQLLPRLEALEREGQTLTISEESALQNAVEIRLAQLSQRASLALKRVSCFSGSFTEVQAQVVMGVDPATLRRLAHVFPLQKTGERFYLLPSVRDVLRGLLDTEVREAFYPRHFQYLSSLIESNPTIPADCDEKLEKEMVQASDNCQDTVHWILRQPPTKEGVMILCSYWRCQKDIMSTPEVERYLESAVELESAYYACIAAQYIGDIACKRGDFEKSLEWYVKCISIGPDYDPHVWQSILYCAHHSMEDALFDWYSDIVVRDWPNCYAMLPESQRGFKASVHCFIAENAAARKDFAKALRHNDLSFSLKQAGGSSQESLPSLWGQRATILQGLGRSEAARSCWDTALRGYTAQGNMGGVAECYLAIARESAQGNQPGLAISLAERAIVQFEEVGNHGAVAAARGTLGDIVLQFGERERAWTLYQSGLSYWQDRGHPRWIARFLERIEAWDRAPS